MKVNDYLSVTEIIAYFFFKFFPYTFSKCPKINTVSFTKTNYKILINVLYKRMMLYISFMTKKWKQKTITMFTNKH